ncbi:MAG: Fic family protein [Nanoarchaeota archaeon]|nr:Fic family protein [Nanoarchaeota archaeon]
MKPIEVVKKLKKGEEDYHNIHKLLRSLVKDRILIKVKDGFEIKITPKTELLYKLIYYCTHNGINYNLLLDKNIANFIYESLKKEEFQQKYIKVNPKTFKKYIEILDKFGLILISSKKPLKARIFDNALINNLLIYFDFKTKPQRKYTINYLDEIEKELSLYKRLRKNNEKGYQKIVDEFEIHFVQHSLSLEGNPITLPDTIKILKEEIIPRDLKNEDVEEVKNYQNAILRMLREAQQRKSLTQESILEYHKLAMINKPKIAGIIRDYPVRIDKNPNFKTAKPEEVKPLLKELLEKYNEFLKKKKSTIKEIVNFSAYFHNQFQYIHPFGDGNSRTTRLITFHLLHLKGIPMLDIPFGLLDEYLSYTKGSKKRDDKQLFENLQKTILFNLKKINERLI